jgi:molybdopterin molybdotransferase
MLPALRYLAGLPPGAAPRAPAVLAEPLSANGPREHYMRGHRAADGRVHAASRQDSGLQKVLAQADLLIVRPPHDPPRAAGETIEIVKI